MTKRVLDYYELENFAYGLPNGFGYPGQAIGIIHCVDEAYNFGTEEQKLYIEVVNSYSEGYSVERIEINNITFAVIKSGLIDKYFNKNQDLLTDETY